MFPNFEKISHWVWDSGVLGGLIVLALDRFVQWFSGRGLLQRGWQTLSGFLSGLQPDEVLERNLKKEYIQTELFLSDPAKFTFYKTQAYSHGILALLLLGIVFVQMAQASRPVPLFTVVGLLAFLVLSFVYFLYGFHRFMDVWSCAWRCENFDKFKASIDAELQRITTRRNRRALASQHSISLKFIRWIANLLHKGGTWAQCKAKQLKAGREFSNEVQDPKC